MAAAASGSGCGLAHKMVLCARSAYFDRAFSGEWTEAADRRIELTVDDEQELEDLQLLIKLSYSDSYTHDDGELLPLDTRLRLAVRADALEFVEALDQIVASILLELDFKGALKCCSGGLPPILEAHAGMAAARQQIVAVLAKGIEERQGKADEDSKQQLQAGVEALAKALGPVAGMFGEAPSLVNETLPLCDGVKQLSLCVFKRLLASDALQLQSENEPKRQRAALFKELAPLLRFHHMTSDYLANAVSQCSLMQASGLLSKVMHAALGQRNAIPALMGIYVARGRPKRGVAPSQARWDFSTSFTLKEVAALELSGGIQKWCGLVAGYPASLYIQREQDDKLGIYMFICQPETGEALEEAPTAGVGLKMDWSLPPNMNKSHIRYFAGDGWGSPDIFEKPWADVVREGSPHFPGGKLEVKVSVKLATEE